MTGLFNIFDLFFKPLDSESGSRSRRPLNPKSKDLFISIFILKGQSNEIFDLEFFSAFEPSWIQPQLF